MNAILKERFFSVCFIFYSFYHLTMDKCIKAKKVILEIDFQTKIWLLSLKSYVKKLPSFKRLSAMKLKKYKSVLENIFHFDICKRNSNNKGLLNNLLSVLFISYDFNAN